MQRVEVVNLLKMSRLHRFPNGDWGSDLADTRNRGSPREHKEKPLFRVVLLTNFGQGNLTESTYFASFL
jgi:hypothetical protein